jgi:phage-related protein
MYNDIDGPGRPKWVRWVGTSLRDLRSFPKAVRVDIGQALFTAQEGKMDPAPKPPKGFGGAGVLEIVASHRGDTWRAVYTVRFQDAIYVLHTFFRRNRRRELPRRRGKLS